MTNLQIEFEKEMKKAGYRANFCPNCEWIRKVTLDLFDKFNIIEKETENGECI
jgi:hypothetical protein